MRRRRREKIYIWTRVLTCYYDEREQKVFSRDAVRIVLYLVYGVAMIW